MRFLERLHSARAPYSRSLERQSSDTLKIEKNLTVLRGDSATGKTTLIFICKNTKKKVLYIPCRNLTFNYSEIKN